MSSPNNRASIFPVIRMACTLQHSLPYGYRKTAWMIQALRSITQVPLKHNQIQSITIASSSTQTSVVPLSISLSLALTHTHSRARTHTEHPLESSSLFNVTNSIIWEPMGHIQDQRDSRLKYPVKSCPSFTHAPVGLAMTISKSLIKLTHIYRAMSTFTHHPGR